MLLNNPFGGLVLSMFPYQLAIMDLTLCPNLYLESQKEGFIRDKRLDYNISFPLFYYMKCSFYYMKCYCYDNTLDIKESISYGNQPSGEEYDIKEDLEKILRKHIRNYNFIS